MAGVSRQSYYQRQQRLRQPAADTTALLEHIKAMRAGHYAAMGCRKLYAILQNDPEHSQLLSMGRRAFEQLLLAHNLGSPLAKPLFRANKSRKMRFANQLQDKDINGTDQVWVSDTTYIQIEQQWYYLTQVVDYYSREVIALHISKGLCAEQTSIPALQAAIDYRNKTDLGGCIIHSDGGTQYGDAGFLALVERHRLISSMARMVFENTVSERFNGVFKQEYLALRPPANMTQLKALARYAQLNYNTKRPHAALKYATPQQFAQQQMQLPPEQRLSCKAWTIPSIELPTQPNKVAQPTTTTVLPTLTNDQETK